MQYLTLKGARIPSIGFGTWPLRGWSGRRAISRALRLGYHHIDTAQIYDNEADVGRAIRKSGIDRAELFLTTKLHRDRMDAASVRRSTEESLRRLGTDYVDLLMIHWPSAAVPLAETLDAMAELRVAGKARFLGVCNFNAALVTEAVETHRADLLCNQVEYHPFLTQDRVRDALRRFGMALVAYAPLARGQVAADPVMRGIAERHCKTPAQIALRWLIEQENVAAIPKSSSTDHAAGNLAIFDFSLTDEDRAAIGGLGQGRRRLLEREPGMADWDPA